VRREATSEDRGEFRLDDLLPGNYHITVNAKGFAVAEADVSVPVATVRDVTVTLKLSVQETVRVQAETSSITSQPIDLASVVHQGVVSRQDIETLPLAARSFANMAYLVPGTEPVEPSDPRRRASLRSLRAAVLLSTTNSPSMVATIPTTGSAASCRTSHPMPFRNSPCELRRRTPIPEGPPPAQW